MQARTSAPDPGEIFATAGEAFAITAVQSHGKQLTHSVAIWRVCLATALLIGLAASASSQEQPASWPSRPIKIITPLAAGGAADILARAVGDELFATLKQPVVIENRPGGGGMLAASIVARAAPDGYTLLLGTAGSLTITPVLSKNAMVDPINDFTPLTTAIETPICLVVHKALPVNSVADLVAYALSLIHI